MNKRRIAIFSSNDLISRFFEIEAVSCGFLVDRFDRSPENISDYDLVIIDSDTVQIIPSAFSCVTVILSGKNRSLDEEWSKDNSQYSLKWPTDINKIREIFFSISASPEVSSPEPESHEDIIYYSEKSYGIVWYRNKKIVLSDAEMKLLTALCKANVKTVSRKDLNLLFEAEGGNIVDVYIHHLRKKLEDPFSSKLIYTVRSKGYFIKAKLKKL